MNINRVFLLLVLIGFGLLTFASVANFGVLGIFQHQLQNVAGWQVFVDLVIALTLFLVWMWKDAKRTQRNPWPRMLLTLVAGSFGPLLYLFFRKSGDE